MKLNTRFLAVTGIIILAAFSRLIPHLPNFTAVSAAALFGAAFYNKKYTALLVPVIILFITDAIIGFYPGMGWVYANFILVAVIGLLMLQKMTVTRVIGASLLASVSFYALTNFGMWIAGTLYPHTFSGLVDCYVAAIPFSRYETMGTLFYSAVMFGSYYLAQRRFPVLVKSNA